MIYAQYRKAYMTGMDGCEMGVMGGYWQPVEEHDGILAVPHPG